jgi:hypothetical protein
MNWLLALLLLSPHPVLLSWTSHLQPPGIMITSQRLYRNELGCGHPALTMTTLNPGITSDMDIFTKSHHRYSYWIAVVDQDGIESAASNCVTSGVIP